MAMQISLYDASVSSYLQTLDAVAGFLDQGLQFCRESGIAPMEMIETRLFPDMQPLRFQIQRIAFHSAGAIAAIRSGAVDMPSTPFPADYGAAQALIDETRQALQRIEPEEIDRRAGADIVFTARGITRLFSAEGFLMSFSLPNFHFHATTAYNILRSRGVPLGKLDYMGALRLKSFETP